MIESVAGVLDTRPALRLKVLGSPEVRCGEHAVKFRSRKEQALLVYLAVTGGQYSRETLIDLLWPESDRKLGQAALRNTLVRVRQALGPAGPCIRTEAGLVSFQTGGLASLDIDAITRALAFPVDADALPALHGAVASYRGDFLQGFSLADALDFDDWSSRQREFWHQQFEKVLRRLSRLQYERGETDEAIATTRRWIAHDPLSEAACRRLMHLHFLAGDRAAALRVFEHCARTLADELGIEPDDETVALAQRIRTEAPPDRPSPSDIDTTLFHELPFVGRAAEYSRVVAAYRASCAGSSHVVSVTGEAGIGKTRLVGTLLRWASAEGADVLSGRAFEAGGQLPYQPITAALRERLAREPDSIDLLDEVWLRELTVLLPELPEYRPELPSPASSDPNLGRAHLFEAIAQLGQVLAERRPVVLFLDDLQWADTATLEVVPHLCRRWRETGARVLLLITVRSETLAVAPDLRAWLSGLEHDVVITRLELARLTEQATEQIIETIAASSTDQAAIRRFSGWLFAETAGQPYYIAETLKMLVERAILPVARGEDGRWTADFRAAVSHLDSDEQVPIPPGVRQVILSRLGRLSESGRALLAAGSVLGRPSSFELLCRVSGIDEIEGLTVVDELTAGQILYETPDAVNPYTFSHDKIRDVVYSQAGEARRRLYHRRAFEALKTEPAPAADLARHALQGKLPEPAFQYSIAAGHDAVAMYAYAEAAGHYRTALSIIQPGTGSAGKVTVTNQTLTDIYQHLGRTLELMSRHEDAMIVYRELESLARQGGDPAMELAAVHAQITPLATVTAVFDPVLAEQLAERALQLAHDLGDPRAEADILWNQLVIYRHTHRIAEALTCGERALALARQHDLRERMAFVLHDLGYLFAFLSEFPRASELFTEAAPLWRERMNLPMLADSLTGLCLAQIFRGEYDAAVAAARESMEIAETIGSEWARAGCRHNIGYVYADRGEIGEAIAIMEEAIRLSEKVSFVSPLIIVPADLGRLYASLGQISRGIDLARYGVHVASTRLPILRSYPLATLAQLLLAAGEVGQAEGVVEEMRHDPHPTGLGFFPTLMAMTEARLALAQQRCEEARTFAQQGTDLALSRGTRTYLPSTLDLEARAWEALGRPDLARERWLRAKEEAEWMGARTRLWPILLSLSRLEASPERASALQQEARRVVGEIAARCPEDTRGSFLAQPEVCAVMNSIRPRQYVS